MSKNKKFEVEKEQENKKFVIDQEIKEENKEICKIIKKIEDKFESKVNYTNIKDKEYSISVEGISSEKLLTFIEYLQQFEKIEESFTDNVNIGGKVYIKIA